LRELLPVLAAGLVPFAVLVLIVAGTVVSLVAWEPPILRTIEFGTANSDNSITAIASDSNGVYAAGYVGYSNVTPTYLFVNRYGIDGHQVWSRHFGDPYLSQVSSLSVGTDGVYVAGYLSFSSASASSFVAKYDFSGNQLWNSSFFPNRTSSASSVSSSTSGVYVAGYNGSQYFVKNYDLSGGLSWTRFLGSNQNRISVLAGSSKFYVAYDNETGGYFVNDVGLVQEYGSSSTPDWTRLCSCEPMGITGGGTDLYVFGLALNSISVPVGFLTKYDLDGNQLWTTQFNPPSSSLAVTGVAEVRASVDSSGIYVTTTTGDDRGIVLKYDGNGKNVWSLQLPWMTAGSLRTADVISVEHGEVFVAGDLRHAATATGHSAFLAAISQSSSLVLFGINPPFSFALLALLVVVAIVSPIWLRKYWKRRIQRAIADKDNRLKNIPADFFSP